MAAAIHPPQDNLRQLKHRHLTTAFQLLLLSAPTTYAFLGRKAIEAQTTRKRKRDARDITAQSGSAQKRTKLQSNPHDTRNCGACGTPFVPGWNVKTRIENVRTSRETRLQKQVRQRDGKAKKLPRNSKRRKAAWGERRLDQDGEAEKDGDGGLWFSSPGLKAEFKAAKDQDEEWARRVTSILTRWDSKAVDTTGREADQTTTAKTTRTREKPKSSRKILVQTCQHCEHVTRQSLDKPTSRTTRTTSDASETGKPKQSERTPQEISKVDAELKPLSQGAKSKARAKLRKQSQLASLVAKSKAEEAQKGERLGFMLHSK